jgi:hypothetical protein
MWRIAECSLSEEIMSVVKMATTDWAMAALLALSFIFAYFVVKTLDAADGRTRLIQGSLATSCAMAAIALILNFGTGG